METSEYNEPNKGTVLIVDDTPGNLAVLSDMLSEAGYRVLVATDGLSALEQIGYLIPDIILLDVIMPGIDGFETCRRLKSDWSTLKIPIIFMTGLSELEDLLKGFDQGAVDYIVKPIRPAEVLARLEAQLSQTRKLQRAEDSLSHVSFAALTIDGSGQVTWFTTTAIKVLYDCFPDFGAAGDYMMCGDFLPRPLLDQLAPRLRARTSKHSEREAKINLGNDFSARLIRSDDRDEYMLLIQKCSQQWDSATLKRSFGLTPREAEILMWIARGKTNKEVGLILNTSPRTVNKHLEHVFEKLGVPTRTAAIAKILNSAAAQSDTTPLF